MSTSTTYRTGQEAELLHLQQQRVVRSGTHKKRKRSRRRQNDAAGRNSELPRQTDGNEGPASDVDVSPTHLVSTEAKKSKQHLHATPCQRA